MTSLPRAASLVALLGLWIVLSLVLPSTIVPGPIEVGRAAWGNIVSGEAFVQLSRTVLRVALGLALAMGLGLAVGLAMGLSRRGEVFLESWVLVGLTVPAIVYGMICLLWFGLNDLAAIAAIGITAFPSVAINIWQGVKSLDPQLVSMGRAFRLTRRELVLSIILPQLVPYILAALRFALGICWKICTTVELIGMSNGVGYMLNYWFGLFSMAQVFAWTLTFLAVMFVIEFAVFKPLESRLVGWRQIVHV